MVFLRNVETDANSVTRLFCLMAETSSLSSFAHLQQSFYDIYNRVQDEREITCGNSVMALLEAEHVRMKSLIPEIEIIRKLLGADRVPVVMVDGVLLPVLNALAAQKENPLLLSDTFRIFLAKRDPDTGELVLVK
jgi:hypothetical protein